MLFSDFLKEPSRYCYCGNEYEITDQNDANLPSKHRAQDHFSYCCSICKYVIYSGGKNSSFFEGYLIETENGSGIEPNFGFYPKYNHISYIDDNFKFKHKISTHNLTIERIINIAYKLNETDILS